MGHHCADASWPPAGSPKFHGDRMVEARAPEGAALRIGSTPASRVMAIGAELELPWVATSMTASPLFKSLSETAGMRLSICWKSGGPPPARQFRPWPPGALAAGPPKPPESPDGRGPLLACGPWAPGCPGVPAAAPFNRVAMIVATRGGSLRSRESSLTLTTTGCLVVKSLTVTVLLTASVDTT